MTAFFCDTNCELNYKTAAELGIRNVIRMPYTICDKEYFYDLGEHYDAKWFFNLVREGNVPITSALNAEDYKTYFEPYYQKGEDIFYVSFSSEMSGTFNYMEMAIKELSQKYPGVKFTRYDTRAISMAAGIQVAAAAKLFNEGKSVEEIVAFLDNLSSRVNAFVVVDDLNHLKRGGRITAVKAAIGSVLQLKPVIKLTQQGKLSPVATVRGRNQALKSIVDETIATATDLDKYPIVILNGDCKEEAVRVADRIRAALPGAEILHYDIGPVIGTHCGPGTIAICFVGGERPSVEA